MYNRQENIFDNLAGKYHRYNPYYFEGRLRYVVSALKDIKGSKVLDLGCGIGTLMVKLKGFFPNFNLYGVDSSRQMIQNAIVPNTSVADAENLPFSAAEFDAIVMSDVIEHVDDLDKVMANCARCVRTGGRVIITTPNPFLVPLLNLSGKLGLSFANENQLDLKEMRKSFLSNGFKIIDETTTNLYPFGPHAIRKAFLKVEGILPAFLKEYICFSKCFVLLKA